MPLLPKLSLVFAILWWAPLAVAQSTLGALLDAGANVMSAEEFKQELVQRVIAGPTPTGGTLEIMYVGNGVVEGAGTPPGALVSVARISGAWTIDENGRICTSMRIGPEGGGSVHGTSLPQRCQFWFKLGEKYFLSDSDSDRSAKVLVRTLKQ